MTIQLSINESFLLLFQITFCFNFSGGTLQDRRDLNALPLHTIEELKVYDSPENYIK